MLIMRKLYDWTIGWAVTPVASFALFFISLIEAIFFPIPPDVLLVAMSVARSRSAFRYAALTLLGSVLGGVIGYFVGLYLMDTIGMSIISFYDMESQFESLRQTFKQNAVMAIAISGFTPIPFKVFTISSGAFGVPLVLFIGVATVSRAARFFLVAALFHRFGAQIKSKIDRYFNTFCFAFVTLLLLGFACIKWLL